MLGRYHSFINIQKEVVMRRLLVSTFVIMVSACCATVTYASCAVEDYRWESKSNGIKISGATSCKSGRIYARLYCDGKFVVSDSIGVKGYIFEMYPDGACDGELTLKYTIEQ